MLIVLFWLLFSSIHLAAAQDGSDGYGQFVDLEKYDIPATHLCSTVDRHAFLLREYDIYCAIIERASVLQPETASCLTGQAALRLYDAADIAMQNKYVDYKDSRAPKVVPNFLQQTMKNYWKITREKEVQCIKKHPMTIGPCVAHVHFCCACTTSYCMDLLCLRARDQSLFPKDRSV